MINSNANNQIPRGFQPFLANNYPTFANFPPRFPPAFQYPAYPVLPFNPYGIQQQQPIYQPRVTNAPIRYRWGPQQQRRNNFVRPQARRFIQIGHGGRPADRNRRATRSSRAPSGSGSSFRFYGRSRFKSRR